jgi:hypothetical protein
MRNQSVHSRHQSILARHQTVHTRHRGISQGTLVAGAKRGMSQSKRGMQSAKQSINQTINQPTDHSQCYINKSISQSINHKRGKSRACPQTCDNHGNRWYADSSLAVDDEEGVDQNNAEATFSGSDCFVPQHWGIKITGCIKLRATVDF